jgi:hypothetical protein
VLLKAPEGADLASVIGPAVKGAKRSSSVAVSSDIDAVDLL